jgi:hypothetical protein
LTTLNARLFRCIAFSCLAGAFTYANAGPQAPTTTTLTVPVASSPLNATVTLTATISPGTATGKVTFFDGVNVLGTVPSTRGVATLNWTPFLAGQRSLRAFYQGDDIGAPSYSPVVNLTAQAAVSGSFGQGLGNFGLVPANSPVIADFNNDKIPDLAALESNGNVLLLTGNGESYAVSEPITGLSGLASGMAAADFNGDGLMDLAVADTGNMQIVVFIGNGDGTFQPGVSYGTFNPCSGMVAADFTGDGSVDLVTSSGSYILLFSNLGNGTFEPAFSGGLPDVIAGFAAGDFNGDGIADLAVAVPDASTVFILPAQNGVFGLGDAYEALSANSVTVADFNGDHNLDLMIVYGGQPQNAGLLLGNGNGTFQNVTSAGALLGASTSIVSGDLDGDNFMDVVALGPGSVTILMGHGDGTFYPPWGGGGMGDVVTGVALGAVDTSGRTGGVITGGNYGISVSDGGPYPAEITAGDQQVLEAGSAAPVPLQVQLIDFGHPVQAAGIPVVFSAPLQGPGGYFLGSGTSVTVNTAADGTATAPEFVSNSAIGVYPIEAGPSPGQSVYSLTNVAPVTGQVGCSYSVSPSALVYNSNGGSNTVSVTPSLPGCSWSTSSDSTWIVPAAANFTGTATVAVTAPANLSGNSQTGNLLVAGQYISVLQWATAPVVTDAPSGPVGPQVTDMIGYGFSSGCSVSPLDYCPNEPITRAQAAILLVRGVYGSDNFSYSTTPHFNDVDASTFGFQWIQKLFELGITSGCGNGDFCPSENLPRDQAAVLVVRSQLGPQTPFDSSPVPYFSDVPPSAFGFPYIQRLRMENITAGCAAGTFCPSDPITRGDLAVFIMRALTNQFLPAGTALISEVTSPDRNVRLLPVFNPTTLTITGQNTHFDPLASTILVAGANTVSDFQVYSPTYATVTISGTENTVLDAPESIIITTGNEEAVIPNAIVYETECN